MIRSFVIISFIILPTEDANDGCVSNGSYKADDRDVGSESEVDEIRNRSDLFMEPVPELMRVEDSVVIQRSSDL